MENNISGLENISVLFQEKLGFYIKPFVLLNADNTIIMSDPEEGLTGAFNLFETYCNNWRLKVNTQKNEIIIFAKRKFRKNFNFVLFGNNLEITDFYPYLGALLNHNGSFRNAKKKLIEQAQKELYALDKKLRSIAIPIDLQLKLSDALISPILL